MTCVVLSLSENSLLSQLILGVPDNFSFELFQRKQSLSRQQLFVWPVTHNFYSLYHIIIEFIGFDFHQVFYDGNIAEQNLFNREKNQYFGVVRSSELKTARISKNWIGFHKFNKKRFLSDSLACTPRPVLKTFLICRRYLMQNFRTKQHATIEMY